MAYNIATDIARLNLTLPFKFAYWQADFVTCKYLPTYRLTYKLVSAKPYLYLTVSTRSCGVRNNIRLNNRKADNLLDSFRGQLQLPILYRK